MTERAGLSVAVIGSGGAGALTAGRLLLECAGASGWHGMLTRSVGPQIRGGEAAALLRLATHPVESHGDRFDLVVGIDWLNAERFEGEIELGPDSLVLSDPEGGQPPSFISNSAQVCALPFKALTKSSPAWRANMIALGAAAQLLGLDMEVLAERILRRFGPRGSAASAAGLAAADAGARHVAGLRLSVPLPGPARPSAKRWLLTGNEAVGLGAVRGGVRFAAAYPITPASEILEWLTPSLARTGGTLVQAEDEIAAVNMIIGASYGGTPALTATSGPGLSLMVEAIGLATAAEVPIVVVDVMRAGPSTGIPTRSEQSDLNIAVYGMHGDAPHLVVAPQSVPDCLLATQWAVHLAESLQTPAIVLSDQFMGQALAACERPVDVAFIGQRLRAVEIAGPYRRYAVGDDVSPMAVPGTPAGQYIAEGLTHEERGRPTSGARDHRAQLDKRRDKLERFAYGDLWASLEGEGADAILTWGSVTGAAREAVERLKRAGRAVRLIAPRLLCPAQPVKMAAALAGVERLLVVEQSHGAQFHRYLRAHYDLPGDVRLLNRPAPLPLRASEICDALMPGEAA